MAHLECLGGCVSTRMFTSIPERSITVECAAALQRYCAQSKLLVHGNHANSRRLVYAYLLSTTEP